MRTMITATGGRVSWYIGRREALCCAIISILVSCLTVTAIFRLSCSSMTSKAPQLCTYRIKYYHVFLTEAQQCKYEYVDQYERDDQSQRLEHCPASIMHRQDMQQQETSSSRNSASYNWLEHVPSERVHFHNPVYLNNTHNTEGDQRR